MKVVRISLYLHVYIGIGKNEEAIKICCNINTHDWSKQSKSTRSSLIVPSESNDDLLEGQIFIHVTILLYLLIAKQGTCIFVWFLHFFSCLPKSTRQNAHVSTCNKNFTCTNYCLYASPWSYSFGKDCFSDFCTCWTKKITTLSDDYSVVLSQF